MRREVVLFADTFNRYFEPENIEAALGVLAAAGYRVHLPQPVDGARARSAAGARFWRSGWSTRRGARPSAASRRSRPSSRAAFRSSGSSRAACSASATKFRRCCKSDEARAAGRARAAVRGIPRARGAAGRFDLPLAPVGKRALLHGHCHQKSFGAMGAVEAALKLVPELAVETIESSCCGMAGAFGYGADTIDVSLAMGELSLLPAVRKAAADTLIVADGTSCRHQIEDGSRPRARCMSRACWR